MGVDYMDINDDHDVALKIVSDPNYNERAKAAGTKIVIGCGATPGLTNALACWGVNRMDKATAVRMCWVCIFVPDYLSPGVWDHLFHMYTGNVTQFLEGRYQQVPAYSGERNVTFLPPFDTYPAAFSGHGEAATIPHFIKGLEEASIRSFFFPKAGDDQLRQLVNLGFGSREPLPGLGISPLQFFIKYAASDLGKNCINVAMPEEGFPGSNANQVEVEGIRDGNKVRLTLETHLLKWEVVTRRLCAPAWHCKPGCVVVCWVAQACTPSNLRSTLNPTSGLWCKTQAWFCMNAKKPFEKTVS